MVTVPTPEAAARHILSIFLEYNCRANEVLRSNQLGVLCTSPEKGEYPQKVFPNLGNHLNLAFLKIHRKEGG